MVQAVLTHADTDASAADLIKAAVEEARELVKLEVQLAKNDVESELTRMRAAAITFGVAVVALNVGVAMALFAVAIASQATVVVALVSAGALLLVSIGAAYAGYRELPTSFLARTRGRLGDDIKEIEERVTE